MWTLTMLDFQRLSLICRDISTNQRPKSIGRANTETPLRTRPLPFRVGAVKYEIQCVCFFYGIIKTAPESRTWGARRVLWQGDGMMWPGRARGSNLGPRGRPANTKRVSDVGLILGQRRRRWPNIKPTLVQRRAASGDTPRRQISDN